MAPKLGYLLPTREQIMAGAPETGPLLALAERTEKLGLASVWVGDSLFARARHEPLALLAAVAARTRRVEMGTAVLLPALRNPVLLAHQVATVDRLAEGRLILGVGIAADRPNIRAEFEAAGVPFEKRVGRLIEGFQLCKALWSGKPVEWTGRWTVKGATLGPTPHQPGGPPIWIGGSLPASLERAGKHFDGWLPIASDAPTWARQWIEVQAHAKAAGRDPSSLTGAMYLTIRLDDSATDANVRLDRYLEQYYGVPAAKLKGSHAHYAGPASGLAAYLDGYAKAGAQHLILRFAGDHERHLEAAAAARATLGWR